MASFFAWIESTGLATTIAGSRDLTGALSALHLIGLTVIVGSAFVRALRALGLLLPDNPPQQVLRATTRAVFVGCAISIVTGLLLWSARATAAAQNSYFQIKMGVLVLALAVQVVVANRTTSDRSRVEQPSAALHSLALLLWIGVVLSGCAFIFLE
jgi:hypothetical protein